MNLVKNLGRHLLRGLLLRCAEQEGSFRLRKRLSQLSWLLACRRDGSAPRVALAEEPSNTRMLRWPSQGVRGLHGTRTSPLLAFLACWLNDDVGERSWL